MGFRPRLRRVANVAGVVLVVVGFVWLVTDDDLDGAERSVRDYLGLIASGEAEAANAAVEVPGDVDHTLLTDKVLSSAEERIKVLDVRVAPGGVVANDGSVRVRATYRLAGLDYTAELRTKRDGGWLGFGKTWHVIDPVTIPVSATNDRGLFGRASIGGTQLPVLTSRRRAVVYPGSYRVTAERTPYFVGKSTSVSLADDVDLGYPSGPGGYVDLGYEPNDRLRTEAGARILDQVDACLARSPEVTEVECFYPTMTDATDIHVTATPTATLDDFQFSNLATPTDLVVPFQVVASIPLAYTDSLGNRMREVRTFTGMIHFTAEDTFTIDFSDL